jgi:ATP-dependent DNA helicase RecG
MIVAVLRGAACVMAIDIFEISSDQVKYVLDLDEGHFADLKGLDIAPAKLTKAISAFANADGGELFIGIDEDRTTGVRSWRGFANIEAANGHLQPFEALFPLGQDFQYEFLKSTGYQGVVLKATISKTLSVKRASDGKVYIRRGAASLPAETAEALKRLEYAKGLSSFETELVNCPPQEVCNSPMMIEFLLRVVPTAEPDAWLRKQQLLREEKPAVTAVLLFAEEPQAFLPKRSGIKVYRYKTSDAVGTRETLAFDPITIEGTAYDQIYKTVDRTTAVIEDMKILGIAELENVTYPHEALHEIITNAVIHRDYSITDDIHVRVFDNRVEVENPGRLPAHITPDNILDERFARNPALVRLINKFPNPPNKDVGEGLNTAFEAMMNLKLKPPVVVQRENTVLVAIRHEPLASPEELVMEHLLANSEINNTKAREVCHIGSENKMKRVFERLMERKLIERIPGRQGRAIAYRKIADPASSC